MLLYSTMWVKESHSLVRSKQIHNSPIKNSWSLLHEHTNKRSQHKSERQTRRQESFIEVNLHIAVVFALVSKNILNRWELVSDIQPWKTNHVCHTMRVVITKVSAKDSATVDIQYCNLQHSCHMSVRDVSQLGWSMLPGVDGYMGGLLSPSHAYTLRFIIESDSFLVYLAQLWMYLKFAWWFSLILMFCH